MKAIRRLSFKAKLLALCLFMATVSVVIGGVSYLGVRDVSDTYGQITTRVMPKLQNANEMFVEYRRIRISLRTLGLPGITEQQSKAALEGTLAAIADYEKANEAYKALGFSDGQKEMYEKVDASWIAFKAIGVKVLALQKSGRPEDREAMVQIFFKDCPEAAEAFNTAMTHLLSFHKEHADRRTKEAAAAAERTNVSVLVIVFFGVFAGIGVGAFFATAISKSIEDVTHALSQSVEQVAAASTQISSASQELSRATTDQASSLQETAASLEQISAMISKASDSAGTTSTSSNESQEKAQEGRVAVGQMMESMNEISHSNEAIMNQVNDSNLQFSEIVKLIHEIGTKTEVINEIVFQTKLLSFNASVEAARAGEHGKGFAVVAEEVGNLARMSGSASKEISMMLSNSIARVEKIVGESKDKVERLVSAGKDKIESGVNVAQQCSDVLDDIVQNVSRVSGLALEISQATKEQAQGVGEINKAMGQLDAVTQQNTSTSQQAATAAQQLTVQGDVLKHAVRDLMTTVRGSDRAA